MVAGLGSRGLPPSNTSIVRNLSFVAVHDFGRNSVLAWASSSDLDEKNGYVSRPSSVLVLITLGV